MSSDWPVYTVQQLVDDRILAKPKDGNHGSIHPKSSDYVDTGVPFIMATDMIENGVDFKNCKYITEEMAASLRKGFAEPGDVLLSHKATIGRTSILQDHSYSTVVLTPQVTYYRVLNQEILNNKYLHYYFKSEGFQNLFNSWAGGGSTRAYLGITDQRKLPITVPPIGVQKDIARILGDLDQKIHLNQQTNETLELMAQAIFRSWFVDFDPVRAKIEARSAGRDTNRAAMAAIAGISSFAKTSEDRDWDEIETALQQKLDRMTETQRTQLRQTAELFPDELVDSEIGEVPKWWEVVEVQDEIDFQNGKAFRSKDLEKGLNKGLRVFKMGNIEKGGGFERIGGNDFLPPDFEDDVSRYMLKKGDLLMCMTDMKNNVALLGHTALMDVDNEYVLNQRVGRLRRKETSYLRFPYLYYLTNSEGFIEDLRSRANSGVQVNLSTKEIKSSKFLLPPEGVHNHYDRVVSNLLEQKFHNDKENVTLSKIRDTLLPKLISGEIKLN